MLVSLLASAGIAIWDSKKVSLTIQMANLDGSSKNIWNKQRLKVLQKCLKSAVSKTATIREAKLSAPSRGSRPTLKNANFGKI